MCPGSNKSVSLRLPIQLNETATILDRHNRAKMYHAQADTDMRIKAMLKTRNKEYNDFKFQPGDKVFPCRRCDQVFPIIYC